MTHRDAVVDGTPVTVSLSALDTRGVLAPATRTARVGVGIAELVAHIAYVAVGGRPRPDTVPSQGPALWAGAALGLVGETGRRAVRAAEAGMSVGSSAARVVSRLPGVHGPAGRFAGWLARWNALERAQQRRNRAEADAFVRHVVQQLTDAVLDYVDLPYIIDRALQDIDLGDIIRESTEGVTAEAVDAVRSQTVKSDLFVSRLVDRVLLRKSSRDLLLPETSVGDASDQGHR